MPDPSEFQGDWAMRNLISNVELQQRQIDDIKRLLSGFTEQQFSAFDQSGQPFNWEVLARAAGSWPGLNQTYNHPLWVYDASTGGSPQIGVTPGAFSGSIIPTIDGTPINTTSGTPALPPYLTLGGSDVAVYFQLDYDNTNTLTAVSIHSTATTIPTATIVVGTAGSDYYGLSTITVSSTGGIAKVVPLNDYVSGPQGYAQCGTSSNCWLK